jgi:hypothetical protein
MKIVSRTLSGGLVLFATVTAIAVPQPASAQSASARSSRWTVEIYGGTASTSEATGGTTGAAFPVGTPFTTQTNAPSRRQPSWFFGDGSKLLNEVLADFAAIDGTTLPRIVPLDAIVTTAATRRTSGTTIGLRVARRLSPRLTLEGSAERTTGSQVFTDAAATGLEQSRESFDAAFKAMLGTAPVTGLSVSSTLAVHEGGSTRTRISGAARWTMFSGNRLSGHLLAGAGVELNGGADLQAVLNGNYAFRLFATSPMNETDRAVVTIAAPSTALLGVAGGGLSYDLSARVGIRADVRLSVSPNKSTTTVSGAPNVLAQAPAGVLPSLTRPGIQFSSTAGVPSSLSGAALTHTTFTGSGLHRHVSFTVGIFRRF